ncbi:unnamed protein product [Adineta steineri]|uniref:Voltage-gated hydrogen channel 1 n=1 Tax=Adineta steineri TaxID=433720 RepID=A0A815QQ65_9BILA|nr:unnamed protein product [Adineta steineri]CAF1465180.1 unnamed protein product [Adineta steineri]
MVNQKETDNFLVNKKKRNLSSKSNTCYSKWWNQGLCYQKAITDIIESRIFRFIVIFLVIADTGFVIIELLLDTFKIHYECKTDVHHKSEHEMGIKIEHIELGMEIAHYSSIAILTFFVIELIVKIYGAGKEFWNIHRNKMEYFDAFIVITSLTIDLAFLQGEKKLLGEKLLLIFTFRLWRFVRIISSVAEGIRSGERKHKNRLNQKYIIAVHRLIELLKFKTTYLENNNEDMNSVLERFRLIDSKCDSKWEAFHENEELTSSLTVEQFIDDLHGIENNNAEDIIREMLVKSPLISTLKEI